MSIKSMMPSNHLILCRPLLLLVSIFPSIRVFPSESALHIRWPKYWSFSFSTSPSNEYSGLISFRIDGVLYSSLLISTNSLSVISCNSMASTTHRLIPKPVPPAWIITPSISSLDPALYRTWPKPCPHGLLKQHVQNHPLLSSPSPPLPNNPHLPSFTQPPAPWSIHLVVLRRNSEIVLAAPSPPLPISKLSLSSAAPTFETPTISIPSSLSVLSLPWSYQIGCIRTDWKHFKK